MAQNSHLSRREFIVATGAAAVAGVLPGGAVAQAARAPRRERTRIALVGTGVRGVAMYGRDLVRGYSDHVEFVGLCDSNPGRLGYAHGYIGADCPTFVDLDTMLRETRPERLIVTSWDWEHHNHIIAGMRHGCDIVCEKPVTIDEHRAQAILDAQREYGREVLITHNYRYAPHRGKLKELLMSGVIGEIRSVDFHWNITHSHLQQYMQRWHAHRDPGGGSLWVHKGTHHFDLINWWLDSDPVEVFARGTLEHFGHNGPFRGANCRNCAHQSECDYHWDITQNAHLRSLYTDNEHHDGYIRDSCVFRESIDIFDKHAAVVTYANGAYLNYSLTGEVASEGFWLAFNGSKGRIEGREGGRPGQPEYHEWWVHVRGQAPEAVRIPLVAGGHWGGDAVLMNKLFRDPDAPDPLHQAAGLRDGTMSVLVGIAARKSIDSGAPVAIAGLTDLEPMAQRPRA